MKVAATNIQSLDYALANPATVVISLPLISAGFVYVLAVAVYLHVLSGTRLSVAYPFIGLTYVVVVIADAVVFDESISTPTLLGLILVSVGVALIGVGLES